MRNMVFPPKSRDFKRKNGTSMKFNKKEVKKMKKNDVKTKFNAIIMVFLMILVFLAIPTHSVTRTMTNVSDNISAFITNTNGGIWNVTDDDLQLATWNLSNASGTVWLGSDLTIDQTIVLDKYTTLDLQGHNITIVGNNNGFEMNLGSHLKNGNIRSSQYTGNMIYFNGTREFGETYWNDSFVSIKNMHLTNDDYNGTGIMFDCSYSNAYVSFAKITNVQTRRFEYGINMSCFWDDFAQNCFCNANEITSYTDIQSRYQIYFYRNESATIGQGAVSGNSFSNIQLQRKGADAQGPATLRSIYASGSTNYFQGIIWDSADGNRAIELTGNSRSTKVCMGRIQNSDIYNNGTNNRIYSYEYTTLFPYYAQANPPTINENCTAYWYNTTGGWLYHVANSYGTQFYLNMTTTY